MRYLPLLLLLWSFPASADCVCACVNGRVQTLCDSSLEISPICSPRICPVLTPSIRPIQSPRIPPVGASFCRQEMVWTGFSYEWMRVCR